MEECDLAGLVRSEFTPVMSCVTAISAESLQPRNFHFRGKQVGDFFKAKQVYTHDKGPFVANRTTKAAAKQIILFYYIYIIITYYIIIYLFGSSALQF